MSRSTFSTAPLPLLLAAAFLAASGGSPYGLHDCPHHDPLPAQTSDRATTDGEAGDEAAEEASATTDGHHPDGPCTCVGDCHASATTPVPLSGPDPSAVATAGTSATGTVGGGGRLTGPRHELFELHLPNAPPPAPGESSRRTITGA